MSDPSSSLLLQHLSYVGGMKPKLPGEVLWRAGDGPSLGATMKLSHVLPNWVRTPENAGETCANSGCSLSKRKRQ